MFCAIEDLKTESDVEQKLLWPFLSQPAPRGLGYKSAEILTKPNLKRLEIGKGTGAKLYYPDYVVLMEGCPLLVVEAKTRGEDVDTALAEARMYAARINEAFPTGANPCGWVVACNGDTLAVSAWDSTTATMQLPFDQIHTVGLEYSRVVDTIQRSVLGEQARRFRKQHARHPLRRAVSEMGGKSARDEQIGHNTFGSTLALDFRAVFAPVTLAERAYVVQNAYVGSKRRERYVDPIEKLIREASLPFLGHLKQIEDTENPRDIADALDRGAALERQIMLLVGSVGSGKSTFVDHLVNVALPKKLLAKTVWLRVNLNLCPQEGIQDWLLEQVAKELMASEPDADFDDLATLQALHAVDLVRLRKGPLKLLDPDSTEYKTRLVDELLALQKDKQRTVNALSRYLCGERSKLLVLVLDNCDKRTRDEQLTMFQLAQWVQAELRCLTILPIRDVTYDMHQNEPPLDAASKDLVFRIEPPLFAKVLSGRVALALRELAGGGDNMLSYSLPNGMRVTYPSSDQGMYLACIMRSIYEHDTFLRRLLSGLAGRNIRRAIEIFLEFCQSGYISEGEILAMRKLRGNYFLPLPVVASVLLRLNRRFYDGDRSYVKNLFQAEPKDAVPDHFVRLAILRFLHTRRGTKGPSGIRGYHRVADILLALVCLGHSSDRASEELAYLVQVGCVLTEHQSSVGLDDSDLICLAPAGSVHLEMLQSVHYLAGCAEDTWFADVEAVERIKARIGQGRFAHLAEATVLENAKEFVSQIQRERQSWHTEAVNFLEGESLENLHDISAAEVAIDLAIQSERRRSRDHRLHVSNLPFTATADEVKAVFLAAELHVQDVYIPTNPDGDGRGFGFVSLVSAAEVDKAMKVLQGVRVGERPIRVREAAPRQSQRSQG